MENPDSSRPTCWLPLALGLLLFILLWIAYPQQFIASDSWAYSQNAWRISQGEFFHNPDDHPFSHRLGVTLPVAFFYKLFGVSVLTTHLWPLCAALLLIITVWLSLPDERSKKVGLLLSLTAISLLKGATTLHPDVIVAAFLGLAASLFYHRRKVVKGGFFRRLSPYVAVAAFFLALLAKLTAWWMLPFWLMIFLSDVRRKERRVILRFHLPAIAAGLVMGAGYLLFCALIWNDPFSRLHGVEKLTDQHLWSWGHLSFGEKIARLTVSPLFVFGKYYGPVFLFSLLALPLMPEPIRFWGGYTCCMLLLYWFGSTGLSTYQPLPAAGRMTLPIVPGLLITAAWFISSVVPKFPRLTWRLNRKTSVALFAGAAAAPMVLYLFSLQWEASSEERAADVIRQNVLARPDRDFLLVCSDVRSPESLAFYFDYRYPSNLHPLSMAQVDTNLLCNSDQLFLFLHEERSRLLQDLYGYPNYDQQIKGNISAGMELLSEGKGVYLWRKSRRGAKR